MKSTNLLNALSLGKSVESALKESYYDYDVYDDPRYKDYMNQQEDPDHDSLLDRESEYEIDAEKFRKAGNTQETMDAYKGSLEVDSDEIKKGDSDKDVDYWYFSMHDPDLDGQADEIGQEAAEQNDDYSPGYYILYCDVLIDKGFTPKDIGLDMLITRVYNSGEDPRKGLFKEIQSLPHVKELSFDYDLK